MDRIERPSEEYVLEQFTVLLRKYRELLRKYEAQEMVLRALQQNVPGRTGRV
jgi:hypothetical protein